VKNEADLLSLKEKFVLACKNDDNKTVKEYLDYGLINPCENGYKLLRYAIEMKSKKIVAEIINSHFFANIPKDNKYAIQMAAYNGDFEFAMKMLR